MIGYIFSLLDVTLGLLQSLLPIIVFCLILSVMQRVVFNNMYSIIGYKGIVATGVIGTTLHELAHYVMCVIFRHKVNEIRFFEPASDGTLGYVSHSYNPRSLYQTVGQFFIGLAPFYFGVLYFYLTTYHFLNYDLLVVSLDSSEPMKFFKASLSLFLDSIFNASFWNFIAWLIMCLSVILHMMPSRPDMDGAKVGFVALLLLFYLSAMVNIINSGHDHDVLNAIYKSSLYLSLLLSNIAMLSFMMVLFSAFSLFVKKVFVRLFGH